jgi:hypothetical protein
MHSLWHCWLDLIYNISHKIGRNFAGSITGYTHPRKLILKCPPTKMSWCALTVKDDVTVHQLRDFTKQSLTCIVTLKSIAVICLLRHSQNIYDLWCHFCVTMFFVWRHAMLKRRIKTCYRHSWQRIAYGSHGASPASNGVCVSWPSRCNNVHDIMHDHFMNGST